MSVETEARAGDEVGRQVAGRASPGSVLRWALRQQRRAIVGWAIAVAAVSGIYASFFDVIDASEMEALVEGMPEALVTALGYDRLGSAAGFLESTVYGLLGPILVLVFGIGYGARVLAGSEEDGTLELELTSAVGRRQVLLERYAALVVQLAVLIAAVTAAVLPLVVTLDMDVAIGGVLAGGLGLFLLALAVSSVGFAAGAVTGRRVVALGVGTAVAVVGYLADALAGLLEDGRLLEAVSPFAWYLSGDPLVEGVDLAGFGALLAVALVALGVAVVAFERRDLGT